MLATDQHSHVPGIMLADQHLRGVGAVSTEDVAVDIRAIRPALPQRMPDAVGRYGPPGCIYDGVGGVCVHNL